MLADRYWVQRQQFFGQTLLNPFANNGDFVINAIDNLLGNADLISVRSRATSNRPFHLVDDLRREAEQNLRATEQRLEAELAETEQRLTELQQARGDTDLSVLTSEQEAEIDRFVEQRLEIRRQLRQVRRDLDRDIEALGTRVKFINMALMPVLITLFALGLAWRRRQQQRLKQQSSQSQRGDAMNRNVLIGLALLTVVVLLSALYLTRPASNAVNDETDLPLVPGLRDAINDVARIEIRSASSEPVSLVSRRQSLAGNPER